MSKLIDWAPSANAMRSLDGWIGDVPFFRVYVSDHTSEVAMLHNLTQLGFDADSDKAFSYRKISGIEHSEVDAAKAEAEEWFRQHILDRMELVKDPKMVQLEDDLAEAEAGAALREPAGQEEQDAAWSRFKNRATDVEVKARISSLVDEEYDRRRRAEHSARTKSGIAMARARRTDEAPE
jgi:hypothetical protein